MTGRSLLKTWFETGKTPTASQFAEVFDSFFHVSEDNMPLNKVEGLSAAIADKASASVVQQHSTDIANMKTALVVLPTYLAPTAGISSSQSNAGLEVGQIIDITLSLLFTRRDGGNATGYEILKDGEAISTESEYTDEGVQVSTVPVVYTGKINYAVGDVKNTNFNDPYPAGRIMAGAVSASISFVGSYKIFFGAVAATPGNSAAVRALAGQQVTAAGNTLTLNTGSVFKKFCLWLPVGKTLKSVIDQDAFSANITGEYVATPMAINDAGGNPVNGTLYTMAPAVPYSTNHRHLITIQ